MDLTEALQQFDGKHVEPLETFANQLRPNDIDGHLEALLKQARSKNQRTQVASTWIVKRLSERDVSFSKQQSRDLLRLLSSVSHWEAKLHLLQLLDRLEIPARSSRQLKTTIEQLLDDDNKLIRTWAYNGLYVLADQHPRYQDDVLALLDLSQADPAASVKARVRRIRKTSSWAKDRRAH